MHTGNLDFAITKKPSQEQRRALGSFLLDRRSRLSPSTLGLPAGRRRTPGLRREEVASLAGVSVSWYTWLEQGRDIQASAATLRRLSDVFRLNRAESAHLFALSSRETPSIASSEQVPDGLIKLVSLLDPKPTCVRNPRLDILAWNVAEANLFGDYGSMHPSERNTLRLIFLHRPYRALFRDWELVARNMIATFRAARAKAQESKSYDDLVTELLELSPEFSDWWRGVEVQGLDEGTVELLHSELGYIHLSYLTVSPEGRPDLFMTIHTECHPVNAPMGLELKSNYNRSLTVNRVCL